MKILVFSICVSTYCAIQVSGQNQFNNIASNLHVKLESVITNLTGLKRDVNKKIIELDKTDFGLGKQYKKDNERGTMCPYIQIQRLLSKNTEKMGFKKCKSLFDFNIASLLQEFRNTARPRLTDLSKSLDNLKSRLTSIKDRLSGEKLAQEITACKKSAEKCRMTGEFATTVTSGQNAVQDNFGKISSPNLYQIIFYYNGASALAAFIENIVKPITECLNML